MTDREKLVELLGRAHRNVRYVIGYGEALEEEARYLLANGVTVQEWISVEERMPEKMQNVLMLNKRGKQYDVDKGWYDGAGWARCNKGRYHNVTHWMHLPPAPKEGA